MAKTKEILVSGQLTQVTEFDHSAQEIDDAVGKANNAVNKAGDTMTGDLRLAPTGTARIFFDSGNQNRMGEVEFSGLGTWVANMADDTWQNYSAIILRPETAPLSAAIYYQRVVAGVNERYSIFHTGNKPSGSYTGNGSAAERTIDTGGVGSAVLIWSGRGSVLLTYYSGLGTDGSAVTPFISSAAKIRNGIISLATDNILLNQSEMKYSYQVL